MGGAAGARVAQAGLRLGLQMDAGWGLAVEPETAAAVQAAARAFEAAGALDRLEGFASHHGPDFYGLPRNQCTVTLKRESWTPPESYPFGDAVVKPLAGGEPLGWRLVA